MPSPLIFSLVIAAVLWHVILACLAPKLGLVKPNFCKKPIMASYGLMAFPYILVAAVALATLKHATWGQVRLYLLVMGAMWIFGAIDDIWGSREVGGFKGHFKKLLFERKLTTGAVKAMGGGLVALAAGYSIYPHGIWHMLLAGATIALATNLLNLLDLRPGRAVAVLFAGLGVTYIVKCGRLVALPLVASISLVAFAFGIADSRGRAMMGDSGSNCLGAGLGLTIVLSAPHWMIPAIAVMAAVHVYSEKRSISALIERNRLLKAIDRCLGVR